MTSRIKTFALAILVVLVAMLFSAIPATASDYKTIVATHTVATIGTATGVAIAANDDREYLLLINDSDATIYLGIGAAAVVNQGIRINAGGGSYEISPRNGNFTTVDINAIAGGATKLLLVTEGE